METIPSFTIDHTKLKCGLFVSRKDYIGTSCVTTFDIRMKRQYHDEVMETGSVHALEHLIATYLRNDPLWGNKVLYFGPMGCRTGFYLLMAADLEAEDILPLIERTFDFAAEYEGEIPGATPKECGYCVDMDLAAAKNDAAMYYNVIINPKKENLHYPVKRKPRAKKSDAKE